MGKIPDRVTEAAPEGKQTHGCVAPSQLPGLPQEPTQASQSTRVSGSGPCRVSPVLRPHPGASPSVAEFPLKPSPHSASHFYCTNITASASAAGGQSPESRAHTGRCPQEREAPPPLHPGPGLCDSLGLLPTAPRLTTGSRRPLIKSKCNLSCPDADLFEKGRINCGGKKEIILNKCHLDYKMECVLCLAQFSSSF